MSVKIKKSQLFFFLISVLLLFTTFIFAQGLEVRYPDIPGTPSLPEKPLLPEYIKYLYNFSIIIAGLVALFSLVYGGFRYLTSVGSPVAMSDARDQITAGIVGLIILLGSYLLLTTINPQLRFLEVTREPLGKGIILYDSPGCPTGAEGNPQGREGENFRYLGKSSSFLGNFNNKARSIYFFNPSDGDEALKVYIYPKENWEPRDSPSWESEDHEARTCKPVTTNQSKSIFLKWERERMPDLTTISRWYEIPTGTLIEELLDEGRLNRIKGLAGRAEDLSKQVRDKAKDLQDALNACSCGETDPTPSSCDSYAPSYICLPPPVCTGDPCPNRDTIDQKRLELRNAYLELRNWLVQGELYAVAADLKKDMARLLIAKILLEAGQLPLNYDNFLEFKQAAIEAGGEVEIEFLQILGETTRGRGDSSTFYFDAEQNEEMLNDLLFHLEGEIGMLATIADRGWGGVSFPIAPGQQIFAWPTSESRACVSGWYDTYNTQYYIGGCHRALDISASGGDRVIAARDGTVYNIEDRGGRSLGLFVVLEHQYGGTTFYTIYAHLGGTAGGLSIGDTVSQGQLIGYVDSTGASTGNHLHFALQTGAAPGGVAYDPLLYLPPPNTEVRGSCNGEGPWPRRPDLCAPPVPPFADTPVGTGECAVENLAPVFGEHASAASCVCQAESGGNPFALNPNCLAAFSADYSVGLFQMNLLDRCSPDIQWTGDFDNPQCWIVDQSSFDVCKQDYGFGNSAANMEKAWELFLNVGWCPPPGWATAPGCGLCP